MTLKVPSGWTAKPITASTEKSEVKAKLEMGADVAGVGLCPECKTPMERVMHGEVEVAICTADRIVLPLKDAEDAQPDTTEVQPAAS